MALLARIHRTGLAFRAVLCAVALPCLLGTRLLSQPASLKVRIGFSSRNLQNTNRSDLTAAMKAWMLAIAKERNLNFEGIPQVYDSVEDLEHALQTGQVDVISVPTDEFFQIEPKFPLSRLFSNYVGGKVTEQYALLVDKASPVQDLRELKGLDLVILEHPRCSLSIPWLDTELLRRKLPLHDRFFGKLTTVRKPSSAILSVFFKQAQVALVTLASFETARELNPQLGNQLRVLARSPGLIPSIGAFRPSASPEALEVYRQQALRLQETQGGRMVLSLFQADGITEISKDDLAQSRSLLVEYNQLKAKLAPKRSGP